MHIDSFFACANSELDEAEFVIFGVPYDATQSFKPGSRFAPTAIREASWNLENYSLYFNFNLDFAKICDAGNVNVDGSFDRILRNVEEFLSKVDLNRQIPIALGGEHSITYAILKALSSKLDLSSICYVVFDAHFDLRDEFDDNPFNHACTTRRIFELGVGKVIQIGVRSGTGEEKAFAEENDMAVYYSWDVSEGIFEEIDSIVGDRMVYLSIDMDAFDPAFAPGVSTPEPFGLNPTIMLKFFERFSGKIFALDVVEVVPDSDRITQTLSAKLVFEFIASKARSML
jgi:agmatinase